MKKLMVMMGAVATALGLFADTPKTYYSTSFEADDGGCLSGSKFNWSEAGWSFAEGEDNLDLEPQGDGLPYAEGRPRRNDFFKNGSVNSKYLKLETGANTLSHAIDKEQVSDDGQVYIDQLVRFTGYEEYPTEFAADTKIAVWMSAIEADDAVNPPVPGETNLYVTIGSKTGNRKVKLDCSVEPETWYRLTVKSLGNINTSGGLDPQLGFKIFINGDPATIVEDDDQRNFSDNAEQFKEDAKELYKVGQLFTSMTSGKTVSSVGYKGIGALDDLIISQEAPEFDKAISFAVTLPNGVEIVSLVAGGKTLTAVEGKYSVMPNTKVTFNLQAADGHRLDLDDPIVKTVTGNVDLTTDLEGKVVVGYATLNGAIKGEAELADMMAGLKDGDEVAFIKEGSVTNGVDNAFYTFTKNTQIAVANGKWTLTIGNVDDQGNGGTFGIYTDIANDITVAFANGDTLSLGDRITIAAGKTLDASNENGSCVAEGVITVAGTLKGVGFSAGSITLDGAGSVWSKTKLAGSIFTNEKVAEAGDAQSGYTYTIKATPTTGFMVILAGQTEGEVYETLAAAFEAAQAGSTIKMLSDAELTVWIGVNKNVTLDLNGKKVTGTLPADQDALFAVNRGGTFTITDGATGGEIDSGSVMCALKLTQTKALDYVDPASYTDDNKATLVVNGGTIKGFNYAIGGNGNPGRGNTAVTINGGTIMATAPNLDNAEDACAIYNPQENSTLTITGGTISGYQSAVEIRAGTLAITGGTLTATAAEYAVVGNGNGPSCTGAALVISEHVTKKGITAEVQAIENATLTGVKSVAIVNPQGNTESQVTVTLGKATYNGALEFSADAIATVTKTDDAQIDAPAGYEWDANGVLTKKAEKVDPEQPIPVPQEKTPEQVAKEMNDNGIDKYLKVPAGVSDADAYTAMFAAKADGQGAVIIDLKTEVETAIKAELANTATSMLKPDAETSEVTITARPGLFYGIKAVGDVKTIGAANAQNWVQAKGATVKVVRPTVGGNAAFFQAVCSPKAPTANQN